MARCRYCQKQFSQIEALKMVTAHQQPDGSTAYTIPVESKRAEGPVLWAAHYKEFKMHDKREKRGGNSVTGSSLGEFTPNADSVGGMDTSEITARQQLKRTIAQELGIDSENWRVAEVLRRRDHGDRPYEHLHERQMEPWKVQFHLEYAHGLKFLGAIADLKFLQTEHGVQHMQMARASDPDYTDERSIKDWHDSIDTII